MPAEPTTPAPASTYIAAAIPTDSINHFVVQMTPAELRPVVAASIALTKVIENIPRQNTEQQIVQLKLHWWLEEVEMIGRKKPRHPLSVEIARSLDHQAWLDPLHELVRGALDQVGRSQFGSFSDLLPFCHRAAERQVMLAAVLPQCDDRALDYARNSGTGICLTELIHDFGDSNTRIPDQGLDGQPAAATISKLATVADEHFQAAGTMPAGQRRAQHSLQLQARLYQRLLRRLRRHDFDRDKAAMGPVALLWHAWREARNLIK